MKYLRIKNRTTETAPDIAGDRNQDATKHKTTSSHTVSVTVLSPKHITIPSSLPHN